MKKMITAISIFVLFSTAFAQTTEYLHFNKIIARLEKKQIVCGAWVSALHPTIAMQLVELNGYPSQAESMSKPMLDFILVDYEHRAYDISELRDFLLTLNSKREIASKGNLQPNIAVIVRLPCEASEPVHAYIKQALDVGAHGVVIPNVQTAEQAQKVIEACRFPQPEGSPFMEPAGTRGVAPWVAAYQWGLTRQEYVERADVWPLNPKGDILAMIMIESKAGVTNIEEILKVKGLGAVIFGPTDYSFDIGYPMKTNHPEVLAALKKVKDACDQANIPLVSLAYDNDMQQVLKDKYKILLISHDIGNDGRYNQIFKMVGSYY